VKSIAAFIIGGTERIGQIEMGDFDFAVQMKRCRWCNQHKSEHIAGRYEKWCREGTGTSYHPFTEEEVKGKQYELRTVCCLRGWHELQAKAQ
jgi:hypothetical protein